LNPAHLDTLRDDCQWFPEEFNAPTGTIRFAKVTRELLSRLTFLADNWAPADLPRRTERLADVHAALGGSTTAPRLNFIWPTAFCCSTAITRALDLDGRNLSLREPSILMSLGNIKRETPEGRPLPPQALQTAFRLLARPSTPNEQVTVKPTSAVNCFFADAASMTMGNSLVLYCDCRSFLIATAKRRERGRAFQRGLFALLASDGHEQHRWPPRQLFELSDLHVAALVWHMHMSQFLRSLHLFGQGRVAGLNSEEFLSAPGPTLRRLDKFFRLDLGEGHINSAVNGVLGKHAKNPMSAFSVETDRRESEELTRFLGSELEEIVAWSYTVCRTPRILPLPRLPEL
jgi:hypothetical protein